MFRFTNLGRVLANSIGQTPVKSTTPASGVIQNQQNRENTGKPEKIGSFLQISFTQ